MFVSPKYSPCLNKSLNLQTPNNTKGFDKLFKNDATIASKINYATTKDIKSPLATSLEGALQQKITQRLVNNKICIC
nr:hypothetical protein [Helicobacter pylori]